VSLYMDVHTMDGPVGMTDVAKAHAADLQTQDKYGVTWGLVEITEAEAKEIERRPKKHACERVLRP